MTRETIASLKGQITTLQNEALETAAALDLARREAIASHAEIESLEAKLTKAKATSVAKLGGELDKVRKALKTAEDQVVEVVGQRDAARAQRDGLQVSLDAAVIGRNKAADANARLKKEIEIALTDRAQARLQYTHARDALVDIAASRRRGRKLAQVALDTIDWQGKPDADPA